MNRFDYVKFDHEAIKIQESFKERFIELEDSINLLLISPKPKELALIKLEEVYMWIGKAIRDDLLLID